MSLPKPLTLTCSNIFFVAVQVLLLWAAFEQTDQAKTIMTFLSMLASVAACVCWYPFFVANIQLWEFPLAVKLFFLKPHPRVLLICRLLGLGFTFLAIVLAPESVLLRIAKVLFFLFLFCSLVSIGIINKGKLFVSRSSWAHKIYDAWR